MVTRIGKESRNGVKTVKYSIDGSGFRGKGGTIWVDAKLGWIVDMEIAQPDNPDWSTFKLRLLRTEKMGRAQWEKFMAEQIAPNAVQ